MIDRGLVIAQPWIGMILAGEKVWEIRSKPNNRTGRIALAEKGGPLVAVATIAESIKMRPEEFAMYKPKHGVEPEELWKRYKGKDVYAWPLSDVVPLSPPIKYLHPGGGSCVTLSGDNVKDWERLQAGR